MNIYQKLFAYIIVLVTFGAGAFHTLATFSPVVLDFTDQVPMLKEILVAVIGLSFVGSIVFMAKHKSKEENTVNR